MCFDDGPADGQPHAQAVCFGCIERVKHFRDDFRGNRRARIAYTDGNITVAGQGRFDDNFSPLVFHDRQAVLQQVQEYLLQLDMITLDQR